MTPPTDIQSDLVDRLRHADRQGALSLLETWATVHGWERVVTEIIEPTLDQIGKEWWDKKKFTLAQAYVAAKVTEDIVLRLAEMKSTNRTNLEPKGPVVIGNIEEDFHALGRKMVGTFLRAEGWTVIDLGNDVPAAQFVDTAQEAGARVIGVSAMMMTSARNIKRVREEIDRRGLTGKMQLAAGGAIFSIAPGLLQDVGADGSSANALGSPKLFAELWDRSVALEANR